MATRIASRVAARIFSSPSLVEDGRVYRQQAGAYNDYGEFEPGDFTRVDVRLVSVPLTGQERLILPEALRQVETRKFFIKQAVESLGTLTQGDAIQHDSRNYRAEIVHEWGAFREVIASFPFSGDIPVDVIIQGGFSSGFSSGFDVAREV